MRNAMLLSAIGLALTALAPQAQAQAYGQMQSRGGGEIIRCESNDGRQRTCSADTRGGVEIARQISKTACVRGRTWGSDNRGIWVDGGCRADFQVRNGRGNGNNNDYGNNGGNTQVLRCESNNERLNACAVQGGRARLVRQLSKAPCVQGQTWGQDGRGLWVDRGCRAEFEVTQGRGRGGR
ncbi:MAG TPA: DUF3011 domain-containing protein, partial [Luteimonas sp.]|nr:DUF3011 domain-containing protein [Luteimonas sp.]